MRSPPQLREIKIAINRRGRLALHGLPRCRMGHINPSTTRAALIACKDSLIGNGSFAANVKLPEQSPFPLLRTTFSFAGGRSLTSTLTRRCRVRG